MWRQPLAALGSPLLVGLFWGDTTDFFFLVEKQELTIHGGLLHLSMCQEQNSTPPLGSIIQPNLLNHHHSRFCPFQKIPQNISKDPNPSWGAGSSAEAAEWDGRAVFFHLKHLLLPTAKGHGEIFQSAGISRVFLNIYLLFGVFFWG